MARAARPDNNSHALTHYNPRLDSGRGHNVRHSQPPPYTPVAYEKESYVGRSNSVSGGQPKPALAPKPKMPQRAPQLQAVALYDFAGEQSGDLGFRKDDIIIIVKKSESTNDWWTGRLNGQEGVVSICVA